MGLRAGLTFPCGNARHFIVCNAFAILPPMLKEAKGILTPEELALVRKRSDLLGLWSIVSCWGIIFAAMALFAFWPNPVTFLLGVVVVGGRQLGLAVIMHDAAHGILCRTKWLNDFIGGWPAGNALGVSLDGYRPYHLTHHRHTQQDEDPDLVLSAPFPITRGSLRRKIIRDLTGQTFWKQRKAQFLNALGKSEMPITERVEWFRTRLGGFMLMNVILLAGLSLIGQWHLFFVLWLLPMATFNMLITRIRNIAEHAMVPDNDDVFRNARTTLTDPVTALLIAPYGVNYHVEHHLFMWVPWYNLRKLHKMLLTKGYGARMEIQPNYLEVLKIATSKPEAIAV